MKKLLILLFCLLFYPIPVLAQGCIDINTASLAQLDELAGVGPVYAQRIIDGRPYSSLDDLLRVKGIGPATLKKIKEQGLASVGCPNYPNQSTNHQPLNLDDQTNKKAENETLLVFGIYTDEVHINEVFPNPEGSDESEEWIELYNSSSSDVDLSNWQLQDGAGKITTYTIPSTTKILANGYLVFKRPETKIILNNDGDRISLLTPDGKIIDSVVFTNAPLGQSYSKINNTNWSWSATPTPAAANVIRTVTKQTKQVEKTLSKNQKPDNNINIEGKELLAQITKSASAEEAKQEINPWFLFLIVLAITIILATIVLLVKLKFKENVRT